MDSQDDYVKQECNGAHHFLKKVEPDMTLYFNGVVLRLRHCRWLHINSDFYDWFQLSAKDKDIQQERPLVLRASTKEKAVDKAVEEFGDSILKGE